MVGAPYCVREFRRCLTLPHPSECSTISAVGLSFRVRDGTGRFPHAITTENLSTPVPQRVCGVGGNLFSGLVCVDQYVVIKTPGPTHECVGVGLLVVNHIVDARINH